MTRPVKTIKKKKSVATGDVKTDTYALELTSGELAYLCQIFSIQLSHEVVEEDVEGKYITKLFADSMQLSDIDTSTYTKIFDLLKKTDVNVEDIKDHAFVIQQPVIYIAKMDDEEEEDTESNASGS